MFQAYVKGLLLNVVTLFSYFLQSDKSDLKPLSTSKNILPQIYDNIDSFKLYRKLGKKFILINIKRDHNKITKYKQYQCRPWP